MGNKIVLYSIKKKNRKEKRKEKCFVSQSIAKNYKIEITLTAGRFDRIKLM